MARQVSDEAFSEFVHSAWPVLYRTAYLLLGDAGLAEDLVQTALAKTYAAWGIGGRTVATRYGRFDGTATIARSRSDDVDWSLLFNRILDGTELDQITAAIEGYLDTHALA